MTDIIAMHRADLVDAVTAAVAPIKAERAALAAELATCKTARDGWTRASDAAHARIRELEAALRWSLRLTLTRNNADERMFMKCRELANYPAETACVHEYTEGWDSHCKHCGNRGFAPPDRGEKR